ncbi:MAG TPA: DUF1476 domain-containing protein [Rhodobacteraceae bacterium]|nr:DUF1476 domain-containing protein [Paracoccaceae bacterium]
MTTFDERENAYEAKFAHDEQMNFKVQARTNKALAIWAAGLLGKSAEETEGYITEVIAADFEEAGHEDVIGKVARDLGDKSDMDTVRAKRNEILASVKAEVLAQE